jgi:predicted enzyme related to lactoylglutathione lyase
MKAQYLFAGVVVSDIDAGTEWYTKFFGREPAFRPNETEAIWMTVTAGLVYIKADPSNAGHSVLTLAVANLEAAVEALESRGMATGTIEAVGTVGIKSRLRDPDGNEITLVEITG